ncbi:MAG: minor capsid protein [Oscillospiraceae bacterium]|nr:minor capsid protein [Oscillospiraceae bacterium]
MSDKDYLKFYNDTLKEIEKMFDDLSDEIALIAVGVTEERFLFKDHPSINKKADKIIKRTSSALAIRLSERITEAWAISNTKNDELVKEITKPLKIDKDFLQKNEGELKKILTKKTKGLTLSERVWNLNYKDQIEQALDAAIQKGQSAASLSKELKKYLNNPDAAYRRVRDKHGNLKLSANALKYNPGQGVYRSAKENAFRLARTEINRAYRMADHTRWQQLPFVIGFRLRNSERAKTSVCPICEHFNGTVFPKDFVFTGLHASCRCTAIPILDKEVEKVIRGEKTTKQPPLPKKFIEFYKKNSDKKNLPEFISLNMGMIG